MRIKTVFNEKDDERIEKIRDYLGTKDKTSVEVICRECFNITGDIPLMVMVRVGKYMSSFPDWKRRQLSDGRRYYCKAIPYMIPGTDW